MLLADTGRRRERRPDHHARVSRSARDRGLAYTTCQDNCPLEVEQVRGAVDLLDDRGYRVPAIVVAVDPPRDTRARAWRFLAKQHVLGKVRFVLGSWPELEFVWKGFAIQPQKEDAEHQARVTVVDADGYQRVGFFADYLTPEALAHDVEVLLDEAEERNELPDRQRG